MLVQAGLCRTCSETTLLVFPQGGSNNVTGFHSVIGVIVIDDPSTMEVNVFNTCRKILWWNFERWFCIIKILVTLFTRVKAL